MCRQNRLPEVDWPLQTQNGLGKGRVVAAKSERPRQIQNGLDNVRVANSELTIWPDMQALDPTLAESEEVKTASETLMVINQRVQAKRNERAQDAKEGRGTCQADQQSFHQHIKR